jgi:hypothetical protein
MDLVKQNIQAITKLTGTQQELVDQMRTFCPLRAARASSATSPTSTHDPVAEERS